MFNSQLLARIGLDPGTLHPNVLPRPDPITFERADHSRIASDYGSGTVTIVDKRMILTEEEEDLADILSPINDELSLSKSWWLLEIIPLAHKHQKEDGGWVSRTRCVLLVHNGIVSESLITPPILRANLGKGRHIPHGDNYKIRVHRTVKIRMEAEEAILPEGRRYTPRAKPWQHHRLEWVD